MNAATTITYVSHASLLIEGAFGGLITDPWILNEPVYAFTTWKFPAATMPPQSLMPRVKYLYLSHPHEDHFHIPSLDLFPRDVEILIAEYTERPGLRAQLMENTLRQMGFSRIHKLKPFETFDLGAGAQFTMIPAGKLKWWDWENSGFVLQTPDLSMLNMNDCPADAELYAQVKERFGRFDIAWVQYSGVSMFPGCYRMPVSEMKAAAAQRKVGWVQQRLMLEHLEMDTIAPFAGDFAWLDSRMQHCNWSNRSTPHLFRDFVKQDYGHKNIDVAVMYPSDVWSKQTGLVRHHPEIDWDDYLAAIERLQTQLKPKVEALGQWIDSGSMAGLAARTDAFLAHYRKWIHHADINFNVRVRVVIEGADEPIDFVMDASPEHGFHFLQQDESVVDQTLYIRAPLWAAVLDGKVLLNNIQWASQNEQHVEFRLEIAHFWFWFETYIDLNNRNPQALIDPALHPEIQPRLRPQHGVFALEDEWERVSPARIFPASSA